jgi:hypothetical protein
MKLININRFHAYLVIFRGVHTDAWPNQIIYTVMLYVGRRCSGNRLILIVFRSFAHHIVSLNGHVLQRVTYHGDEHLNPVPQLNQERQHDRHRVVILDCLMQLRAPASVRQGDVREESLDQHQPRLLHGMCGGKHEMVKGRHEPMPEGTPEQHVGLLVDVPMPQL